MKKFALLLIASLLLIPSVTSCLNNDEVVDTWTEYAEWRETNDAWLEEMRNLTDDNGNRYYKEVRGAWDFNACVYMHYFNDTTLTRGNLTPHYNSWVDVVYKGQLYDGTPFDSSYLNTTPADSVFRTTMGNVITGWAVALSDMHVGDSCEVIVPYSVGYSGTGSGSILPYSHLVFNMKLVGVPFYEAKL